MSDPNQTTQSVVIGDTEETAPEEWQLSDLARGQTICLECGTPFHATVDNFTLCPMHAAQAASR